VPLKARMARAGEPLALDTALVCDREDHLVLRADGRLDYNLELRTLAYRPSADVFSTVAQKIIKIRQLAYY